MEVSGKIHAVAALRFIQQYPLDRTQGGTQSLSGHYGVEKILFLSGINPRPSNPLARRYTDWTIGSH
jgi:hypothetical protein